MLLFYTNKFLFPFCLLQNILVPTVDTTRLDYFLKMLIDRNHPCLLVGTSGCGKGAIFREILSHYTCAQELEEIAVTTTTKSSAVIFHSNSSALSRHPSAPIAATNVIKTKPTSAQLQRCRPLVTTVQSTHFNFYTTSEIFQKVLDRPLEKKSGRCYAPSGPNRRLIYYVNDLNMPEVDEYGTVQPHTIMRQFMDYRQW